MAIRIQNAGLRISAGRADQFPRDPIPQVAFSGRSNVGKSSLVNCLLARKSLARVSSAPGKTVTVNFYDIDGKLLFADLPGYGFAKRSGDKKQAFSQVSDAYFTANPNIDRLALVVQLIDGRAGVTEDDAMMLRFLREAKIPFLVVMTKTDKLNKAETAAAMDKIRSHEEITEETEILPFSSLKNIGRLDLWRRICTATGISLQ